MSHGQHRRRSTDPKSSHTGIRAAIVPLGMAAAGLLFLAYVFNYRNTQTILDSDFLNANTSVQSHNDQLVGMVLRAAPFAAIVLVAVVAFGIVSYLLGKLSLMRQRRGRRDRKELTASEFIAITAMQGISDKVATRAFELLLPHYQQQMRTRLSDQLQGDLHLKPNQVEDLYGNLLLLSDRKRRPETATTSLTTVLELLHEVERSPQSSLPTSESLALRAKPIRHRHSVIRPRAQAMLSRMTGMHLAQKAKARLTRTHVAQKPTQHLRDTQKPVSAPVSTRVQVPKRVLKPSPFERKN